MTVDQQNMYLEESGDDNVTTCTTLGEARALINELKAGSK